MYDTMYSRQYKIPANRTGLPRAYLHPEQGHPCWSQAVTNHNHQAADTALLEVKEYRIEDVCCEFCCVCVCECESATRSEKA